jgi:hypothetical protein
MSNLFPLSKAQIRRICELWPPASQSVGRRATTPMARADELQAGERGIEGDVLAWAVRGRLRSDRSVAEWGIEIHFSATGKVPLDPPIPPPERLRQRGKTGGDRKSGPPLEREGSGIAGWGWGCRLKA